MINILKIFFCLINFVSELKNLVYKTNIYFYVIFNLTNNVNNFLIFSNLINFDKIENMFKIIKV